MHEPEGNGPPFSLEDFAWVSGSARETYEFGIFLGKNLQAGDILALCGELGAGKTCLTQGLAKGLDVPEEYRVTSPTFTLINEYPGRLTLYHLDLYRLCGADDLEGIGYEDCVQDKSIVVMEWAEKVRHVLPAGTFFIFFTYIDETRRRIALSRNKEDIDRHLQNFVE